MADVRILEDVETDEQDVATPTAKWLTAIIEIIILLLAVVLIVLVRQTWLEPAQVTSGSMENTLKVGERIIIDHRSSLRGSWRRGDIVLIETNNGGWGEDTLVKRVIGLPGETVEVMAGQVYIDGKPLSETYLKEKPELEDAPRIVLGKDQYYVLGDNRNNSGDSREFGPVSNDEIKGRAIRKLWPMGTFKRPDYNL